jgi:hypothetical protein
MQRVVNFRPGQRHDGDWALARNLREFQVHVRSSGFAMRRWSDISLPASFDATPLRTTVARHEPYWIA